MDAHVVAICCVTDVILPAGSLVMRHPGEMSTPTQGSILFGAVNGAIGKSVVHTVLLISFNFST